MSYQETFKPENLTISGLLSCDATYVIPNYQRQYSWTDEQLEELWDDLYESYSDNKDECYFLGSIVVVDDGKYHHELVDGQQRITTIMIMLNVLLKTFPTINSNPDIPSPKGNAAKLKKLIFVDEDVNRLQLQSNPNYDTIFRNRIIQPDNYATLKKPSQASLKKEDPEYKYINTAKFFYDKFIDLSKEGEDELDNFVNYILFKTNLIKIICNNQSFAIKLFLVLNDRGMPLTNSDIIKSYLLDKYHDDKYTDHDREVFNNDWKHIEEVCVSVDSSLDDFLVLYEYYRLRSNPKRQLSDELKSIIQKDEVKSLVSDMRVFADNYNNLFKEENAVMYSLRYIPWKFYVLCSLTTAYQVDYKNREELFRIMRRFFYICWISGKTLNGVKQTSFNLINCIAEKKDIEEISDMLNRFLIRNDLYKRAYESLDGDVYGESFLKPLLFSAEYEVRESTNTTYYAVDNKIHIEHILPQAYKSQEDWNHIDSKASEYVNTLGNLALLSGQKNGEALNFGFDKKIEIYSGGDKKSSGYVGFETTICIVDEYNKGDKKWDIEHIENRKQYLMEIIENMLDISRDDIELKLSDEQRERGTKRKWKYKNKYFNHKELIKELVKDYVVLNNIETFDGIPDSIKNCKLFHHEAIIQQTDETKYSYDLVEIDGLKIYVRGIITLRDANRFIDVMKKHGIGLDVEYEGVKQTDVLFGLYWNYALPKIRKECNRFDNVNPMNNNHIAAAFGVPYCQINLVITTKEARVELYFQSRKELNKLYYSLLEKHKEDIENELGNDLVWKQDDNNSVTKIYKALDNISVEDKNQWNAISDFHAKWAKRINQIIVPLLLKELDVKE